MGTCNPDKVIQHSPRQMSMLVQSLGKPHRNPVVQLGHAGSCTWALGELNTYLDNQPPWRPGRLLTRHARQHNRQGITGLHLRDSESASLGWPQHQAPGPLYLGSLAWAEWGTPDKVCGCTRTSCDALIGQSTGVIHCAAKPYMRAPTY